MYLRKCKDTYFILQNKYLRIYEDSFGAKILRDDQGRHSNQCHHAMTLVVFCLASKPCFKNLPRNYDTLKYIAKKPRGLEVAQVDFRPDCRHCSSELTCQALEECFYLENVPL